MEVAIDSNRSQVVQVLAIGAHPDDVEIGCSALLKRMSAGGMECHLLILTDERPHVEVRRNEALRSAEILGIPKDQVIFAGFEDGALRADRETVSATRALISAAGLKPSVVLTHTLADSHNDHVEATRLAHAVFRATTIFQFPIHLSLEPEDFHPTYFLQLEAHELEEKRNALSAHRSQSARLNRVSVDTFLESVGAAVHVGPAEAFEATAQQGAEPPAAILDVISASHFQAGWTHIGAGRGEVPLVYSSNAHSLAMQESPADAENRGRDHLRREFADRWWGKSPIREYQADDSGQCRAALEVAQLSIVVGGPVSNVIARKLYAAHPELRWRIEFQLPRVARAHMTDTAAGLVLQSPPGRDLLQIALVASLSQRTLLVAGTTASATEAGLVALSSEDFLVFLLKLKAEEEFELLLETHRTSGQCRVRLLNQVIRERLGCE